MPLTPGSAQLPLVPNKQWLYISDPFTDGLVTGPNAAALQESLFCYAYAQGYTGLIMYEMSDFVSGGVLANPTDWVNFINAATAKGLEVAAAFGGPGILDAVIAWNNSNTAKFKMVISEIEWWNYSSNLPFQEPGLTGTYSFFDTLQMFKNYKPQLTSASLELYTYNGWTKSYQEEYNSGFDVLSIGIDFLTIKGNYTATGVDSIVNGKMFQAGQVIRVDNWPAQNTHTFYKLDATNPVTLVAGNTQLKVGQGKQYAGIDADVSGTTLISTFTGVAGAGTASSTSASVTGGVVSFTTPVPHNITEGTDIQINGALPFTHLGGISTVTQTGTTGTTVVINSPIVNNITQKQASGGVTLITTGTAHGIPNGSTILISGLGAGFDGSWVITGTPTTTSFTFNNGNGALSLPTTPDTGSYQVTTMSTVTYTPNAAIIPFNFQNAKVRAEFEVTAVDTTTSPGNTLISLKGDKTFLFGSPITISGDSWYRVTAGQFKWMTGLIAGFKTLVNSPTISPVAYYPLTDSTVFAIPGTSAGTSFDPGFLYGMVNFDLCYSAGGNYDDFSYPYQSLGSELQQCSPYVDVFGLHDYVTVRPSYGYVQSRTLELAQAGASASNPNIKISWIISAEPEFLQSFFIGNPGGGVSRKNVIDAYKYIAYPIVPSPNPPQSANVISAEPNANVQNEVTIDGVIIFKDTEIRPYTTGNGPRVWVNAGSDVTLTATTGSIPLVGTYCDDCLPTTNYTCNWSVIAANPVGGGAPTFSSSLSGCNGSATGTFNFSSPGVYTLRLTVNDNSGVAPFAVGQDDVTFTINSPVTGPFTVFLTSDTAPTCAQSNDVGLTNNGSLTASITAAQAPIKPVTYTWLKNGVFDATTVDNTASPTSSSTRTGLTAGTYQVTAVDSSSPPRSGTATYVLNAVTNVSAIAAIIPTNPICYGGTGEIYLDYTVGSAFPCFGIPPTISWSNGDTGDYITGLPAGSYTATITDCQGCTGTAATVIVDPDPIIPTIVATDTTCGANNGSATVTNIAGGTPPYTYIWSDFQTTQTAVNLAPGPYSVVVTDSLGCVGVSAPVTISSSTGPSVTISGPLEVCCGDIITYTANVTACGPYVTTWSNGTIGSNTTTINLKPQGKFNPCADKSGTLGVNVIDCNGCVASAVISYTINLVTNPVTSIEVISGDPNGLTNCTGDSVKIAPKGGSGFGSWNFGSPASTSVPLSVDQAWFNTYGTPGQPFTFTWTDTGDPKAFSCPSSASITINYPIGVTLDIDVTPVVCGGAVNSGAIGVTVLTSCGSPFNISWTGPISGAATFNTSSYNIQNLISGTYSVTVTDVDGNFVTESNIIVFTDSPTIDNAVITNFCSSANPSSNSGAIDITVTGGTSPYTYLWTRFGDPGFTSTAQDIANLPLGTYTVVVTDANGCTTTDTYTIQYSNPINIDVTIVPPSCWGMCNGLAEVEVFGGTAPYTLTLTGQAPVTLNPPGSKMFLNLCATTYTLDVVDANGCTAQKEFNVGNNVTVTQFTTRTVDPSSAVSQDGAIYIDLISGGGGPPYDYLWTGPNGFTATTQDITGLAPGDYEVTIKTVVFGVPQPTCAVTRKFKLQTSCVEFSLEELKVMLFKFQCCAGVLAKEYVQYQEIGRPDLAECILIDLKYLTLAINALSCIQTLPDSCLSCDDIRNILNQINKICDCDCCGNGDGTYNVTYDPFTDTLVASPPFGVNPPPPPVGPSLLELREDNNTELREDGGNELREN